MSERYIILALIAGEPKALAEIEETAEGFTGTAFAPSGPAWLGRYPVRGRIIDRVRAVLRAEKVRVPDAVYIQRVGRQKSES